jgi:hypothetical protein
MKIQRIATASSSGSFSNCAGAELAEHLSPSYEAW